MFQVVPNTGIESRGLLSSSPLGITRGSTSDRITSAFSICAELKLRMTTLRFLGRKDP